MRRNSLASAASGGLVGCAFLLGLAGLLLLSPGTGSDSSPTHFMEYAYSVPIPLEMLRAGEIATPLLEGEPHLLKPPLLWWMIMLSYKALGVSLWAMRLPSMLSVAATAAVAIPIAALAGAGAEGAIAAGCLTLGAFSLFLQGKMALIDAPLTLAMSAALWGLAAALLRGDPRGLYACGAACGAAMMLKWPVAPAVVGVFLLLLGLSERELPGRGLGWHWAGACAAAALIVVPWNAWMARLYGADYWKVVFRGELFSVRFVTSDNVPWWRFLLMCLGAVLPWSPLLLATLWRPGPRRLAPEERFLWAWVAASLLPFLLQRTKTERYVLFILPALAAWTARRFDPDLPAQRWAVRGTAAALGLAGAAVLAACLWMRAGVLSGALFAAACSAAAWALAARGSLAGLGLGSAAALGSLLGGVLPALGATALPPRAAARPADVFPLAPRLSHLPVRQGRESWQCRDLGTALLAAELGRPLAACGEDASELETLLRARGLAARDVSSWTQLRVEGGGSAALARALRERSLEPLSLRCRVLEAKPGPARPATIDAAVAAVPPGSYLALIGLRAEGGAGSAGGFRALGDLTVLSDEGTVAHAPVYKREFLRANPYWHVWPFRLARASRLRVAVVPEPGEPRVSVSALRAQPIAEADYLRLARWAHRR